MYNSNGIVHNGKTYWKNSKVEWERYYYWALRYLRASKRFPNLKGHYLSAWQNNLSYAMKLKREIKGKT